MLKLLMYKEWSGRATRDSNKNARAGPGSLGTSATSSSLGDELRIALRIANNVMSDVWRRWDLVLLLLLRTNRMAAVGPGAGDATCGQLSEEERGRHLRLHRIACLLQLHWTWHTTLRDDLLLLLGHRRHAAPVGPHAVHGHGLLMLL